MKKKTKKTSVVNKLFPDMSKEQMEGFVKQMSETLMKEILNEIVKKKVAEKGRKRK